MSVFDCSSTTAINVSLCKPRIVKISHSASSIAKDVPVLHSESGSLYEIGPLIRSTRVGSVHRIYRLKQLPTFSETFVRCTEPLAVKTFNKRALMSTLMKKAEENPVNEMIALTMLSDQAPHPCVLPIVELFSDSEFFYMVMPFLRGGDLLDVMDKNRERGFNQRFSVPQARAMFHDVIHGLMHLHRNGIAHRDLSVENILFDEDRGHFVVIDLGMSLRLPRDAEGNFRKFLPARAICGKYNYIAPEVWRQDDWFNPLSCDIWAAGVILFMVLTASAPMERAVVGDPHFHAVTEGRLLDVLIASFQNMDDFDEDMTYEQKVASLDPELLLAIDLAQKLLHPDPASRPSLEEILAHPWMTPLSSACP